VLAYSPDRLSRKYAYQILLIEELARQGVETLFVKAPQGASAEDQLLGAVPGMIAEYERAQILERSVAVSDNGPLGEGQCDAAGSVWLLLYPQDRRGARRVHRA